MSSRVVVPGGFRRGRRSTSRVTAERLESCLIKSITFPIAHQLTHGTPSTLSPWLGTIVRLVTAELAQFGTTSGQLKLSDPTDRERLLGWDPAATSRCTAPTRLGLIVAADPCVLRLGLDASGDIASFIVTVGVFIVQRW